MSLKQNIIYLYFKGKHLITSKSQYQYNHGQYLYFADLNLPQAFEVHFSNKERGESKTQIGSNKLVEIPDEYFWNGALQIYAWVYLHSGTDDGETIYEVRIPLIKRAKPTDEEPLPVQQSAIDKAIAELNNAVDITNENADKTNADKTQVATIKEEVVTLKEEIDSTARAVSQDAQSARESADASEQSAQNSAESERKALDYSDEAKGYAQSALESKDTASQKAQIASDASAEAKDFRDEAETFKNEAEQAKQNIVNYRDETKGYRDETLTAKDDAQTIKGDIQSLKTQIDDTADNVFENAREAYHSMISADNASLSASESAENASQSANEANQSATNASESANQAEEFKNQSATNVAHYPKVVDGYWYVWDASKNEYVNTNVDARGVKGDKGDIGKTGNGIENTVLNSDYTLTITFTDGTSYTTPSIRGEKGLKGDVGNGIASTVLNDDYTLTINFTNGTQYTTPPIRGKQGEKGNQGETGDSGVYIGIDEPTDENINVWIDSDGTADDIVTDVQINGTSIVTDGVANVPVAEINKYGVTRVHPDYGISMLNGYLITNRARSANIKNANQANLPITTTVQHESVFYGLAKAASDTTQSASSNAVGNYTDNAKDKIQTMLGVSPLIASHESDPFESNHVVGELFIINGKLYRAKTALTAGEYINEGTNVEVVNVAEVLDDTYVKNTDYAVDRGEGGIVKVNRSLGISASLGVLTLAEVSSTTVKGGSSPYYAISPRYQHESVFYGLAKASGDSTQSASSNAIGTYTDEAKASIKNMLGVQDNMVVSITKEEDSETQNTNWQSSKTFTEIHNALTKGINVIVDDNDLLFPYVGQLYQNNIYWLAFGISTVFNNTNVLFGYLIGDNNGQTIVTQINQNTPIPQIDDSTTSGSSVWSSGKIKDELDYKVNDVRINDNSIVTDGVAEIPIASAEKIGAVKIYSANGIYIDNNHDLAINRATDSQAKNGGASYRPIVPINQHISTFYGLAKAAGHDEKDSTFEVGTYTDEAKTAIKQMLGVHDAYDSFIVDVEGTDPTITGQPSYRYNCGEILSLTVTPPETGTIDFRFTSGSSPTVLTLPSTVKMPEWWVEVEANTIYEMCITDGVYCGVMSWAM